MTDPRTVLCGMNNPHSADPRLALYPAPSGVAGHRLWVMLHDVAGSSRREYLDGFDRRNLLTGVWNAAAARDAARELWSTLNGRRVVLLGQAVVNAANLHRMPPLVWSVSDGVTWCEVPHPSGRNLIHNDQIMRFAVGLLLEEELARGTVGG